MDKTAFELGVEDAMRKCAKVVKRYMGPNGRMIEIHEGSSPKKKLHSFGHVPHAVGMELRDPRLYSNLRGMLTMESRKERVAAHKKLRRGKHHTIGSAMREGFSRGSE